MRSRAIYNTYESVVADGRTVSPGVAWGSAAHRVRGVIEIMWFTSRELRKPWRCGR